MQISDKGDIQKGDAKLTRNVATRTHISSTITEESTVKHTTLVIEQK